MSEGNILELPRNDQTRPRELSEEEWDVVQAMRADGAMAGELGYSPAKAPYMPELIDAAIAALEPFAKAWADLKNAGDDHRVPAFMHAELNRCLIRDVYATYEHLEKADAALKLLQPDVPAEEWLQDPPGMDLFAEAMICDAFARFNLRPFEDLNPLGLAGTGWRHNVWRLIAELMTALDAARAAAESSEALVPISEHSVVAARIDDHTSENATQLRAHLVISQQGRDLPQLNAGRRVIVRCGRFGLPQLLQGRVLRCADGGETISLMLAIEVVDDATIAPSSLREVAS